MTSSLRPVLDRRWLNDGTLVVSAGAFRREEQIERERTNLVARLSGLCQVTVESSPERVRPLLSG